MTLFVGTHMVEGRVPAADVAAAHEAELAPRARTA
jgi:hypothetical protein